MSNNMIIPELNESHKTYELYGNRSFQDINSEISGRSVVIQGENSFSKRDDTTDMWPYSLSDYLKNYIGRMVLIEYVFISKCYTKRGKLRDVGTNFVGIQTFQNNSVFLLELSTIKSINILL